MPLSRPAVIVIVLLCILLLAAVIAVAVLGSRLAELNEKENVTQNQESVDLNTCDDIAIIGAGVTGSYAAWRMRGRNLKISVYEYSNRIGGRCYTVKLPGIPDVNVEMGAMRFLPKDQPLLNKTVTELGLDIVDSTTGYGVGDDTMFYLRGSHVKVDDIQTMAPYKIPEAFKVDFNTLFWYLYNNFTREDTGVSKSNLTSENRQKIRTIDGTELGSISRQTYQAMYLDSETTEYVTYVSPFRSQSGGGSAAHWLPTSDPSLPSEPNVVKTVAQGFQAIPTAMIDQFLNVSVRHAFYRNHHLKTIRRHENMKYIMTFQPTETKAGITAEVKSAKAVVKCAQKVVLAIPRKSLQLLDWEGLKQDKIKDILDNAVLDVVAAKMYFGYDLPWYRNTTLGKLHHYAVSTTPLSQTYDFGVSQSTGKAVLNPSYTDFTVPFWRDVIDLGSPLPSTEDGNMQIAMSNTSVYLARKFYAEIFNLSTEEVPVPNSAVMRLWDEYPFGAAWYGWRPGYNWGETEATMMQPSKTDYVFITSNTFNSDHTMGWVDGGLRVVERLLKTL